MSEERSLGTHDHVDPSDRTAATEAISDWMRWNDIASTTDTLRPAMDVGVRLRQNQPSEAPSGGK